VVDTIKIRKPDIAAVLDDPSGRVSRDERGNAVWEWSTRHEDLPVHLEVPSLALEDDAISALGNAKVNKVATKSGYNPYESGLILKKGRPKKRSLKELSRWIEARKRLDAGNES
jgi:hypothetical protein